MDKALRYSEARFRRLFETAQDGILLLNAETGFIEEVNPFLMQLLGYSHDEFLGKTLWDIGVFKDSALSRAEFSELQLKGHIRYDNLPLETKDGRSIPVEFVSNIYECDGINVIQCNVRDNTKRHLAEIELRATSRALKMLSESNVALVKATTETDLLNEYCRIAVETGGYRMAWIGYANTGRDKRIDPVAYYGHEDGYLALCNVTGDDPASGAGPVGRAIRTEQVQFVENIETDPSYAL
jgi:PAS domain S-box-containing protein